MRGLLISLAALVTLAPGPAGAFSCAFTLECVDAEPCAPTDYAIEIETDEWRAGIVTPAETIQGRLGVTSSGATYVVGLSEGATHLLTVMDAGRAARYTAHLTRPGFAVTYHGTCTAE